MRPTALALAGFRAIASPAVMLRQRFGGKVLHRIAEGAIMVGSRCVASILAAALMILVASGAHADTPRTARIQAAPEAWLADRAPVEKVTGIAAYISFGDPGPAIEAFAGKVGSDPGDAPVRQGTLFQTGSTSKSFTGALILELEAAGRLSVDDTLGKWLAQYPAWKDVTTRRLLNMSSGIPTYSETQAMSRIWVSDPTRELTGEDRVAFAYPTGARALPASSDYQCSNTNYVLAGMIAAKAAGRSYRDLVHQMVIDAVGLDSTFYEGGPIQPR